MGDVSPFGKSELGLIAVDVLVSDAVQRPEGSVATQDLLESLVPFFTDVTAAHASEFTSLEDVKQFPIRLSDGMLLKIGFQFDRTKGEITGTELFSGKTLTIKVSSWKTLKDSSSVEVHLSVSDLVMIRRQAKMMRKSLTSGLLTEAQTLKHSLIYIDEALIGEPGIDPFVSLLAPDVLEDSQGDKNVRFAINTDNVKLKASVLKRLTQLEKKLILKEGTLTSLFDLTGFKAEVKAYIMSSDSEPVKNEKNLVIEKEGMISFKTDLAITLSRLEEGQITDDRFVGAVRNGMDPSLSFDKNTFVKVVWGKASRAIRKLYALLPEVKAMDWQLLLHMADTVLRSVGRAA